MKKKLLFVLIIMLAPLICFSMEFHTGDVFGFYYPTGTPRASNRDMDSTKCYVSEISRAENYPDGTYNLKLISADWVAHSIFPLYFNFIIKEGDILEFTIDIYLDRESVKVKVIHVSDNYIKLEEVKDSNLEEIVPTEDSL